MAIENLDSFLTTVDEYIDDENKIVSCKWLSRQLALHINQARKVLEAYVDACKKRSNGINIVYTIIGRDSDGMCVRVVQQEDLDLVKEKLEQVISTSIYSIQKAKLPDSSVLYTADYDSNRECLHENSRLGSISYEGAIRLSKEEIKEKTSVRSNDTGEPSSSIFGKTGKSEKSKTPQQKVNFFAKAKSSPPVSKVKEEPVKTEGKKSPPPPANEPPTSKKKKKPTGVAAFMTKEKTDPFATKTQKPVKQEPQESSRKSPSKGKEKSKPKIKAESPKHDSEEDDMRIDDFPLEDELDDFRQPKTKKKENQTKVEKKEKEENKKENKRKMSDEKDEKMEKKKPPSKPSSKSKKKPGRHDSSEFPAKKRRRIQEMSSSSSEDEEEEEEMELPPSPPPVVVPEVKESPKRITKTSVNGKRNKRKKRVPKEKRFLDEDGFMVTEKGYEWVSCSSDEESPVANGNTAMEAEVVASGDKDKEAEPKKKKFPKVSTAQKKNSKQASIMGFFKKQ